MSDLRCTRCALDPDSRSLGDDAEYVHNGESLCGKHLREEGDAARARTVAWMDRYNAQVEAERQAWADLRAEVEEQGEPDDCWIHPVVSVPTVLALIDKALPRGGGGDE